MGKCQETEWDLKARDPQFIFHCPHIAYFFLPHIMALPWDHKSTNMVVLNTEKQKLMKNRQLVKPEGEAWMAMSEQSG